MADTPKNIKLLISDYDGTLAGEDHIVTPNVEKAVKRWIASGRFFTIATGRQFQMIVNECKMLNLTSPVIVRGGAEVVDPQSGKILHYEYMDANEIKDVKDVLEKNNIKFLIEKDDVLYSNFRLHLDFPNIVYKRVEDFKISDAPKIVLKADENTHQRVQKIMDEIENSYPKLNIARTHGRFGYGWDITSVKATKLHGVVKIIEHHNVKRDQVAAVGDSYNDFPLLEAAGLKVAMGNAHEEVKAISDMEVPSHAEDGVAYLIDKLLE